MGIVRRVVGAAVETGATELLLADDPHRLARRSIERLDLRGASVELLSQPTMGSRRDTIEAAAEMRRRGADVVVVLGGDGTCRDVATGWPDVPLIAISTGTNNVYPSALDGTSAGVAAGLVAGGRVPIDRVAQPTKRITVHIDGPLIAEPVDDLALVDLALIDASFVGARAVSDPASILSIVAAIGHPASTGLSAIAGRVHPVDRNMKGGVHIELCGPRTADDGDGPTRDVRVPLTPGSFVTIRVGRVRPIDDGEPVVLHGPGVLAFDGERDIPIRADAVVTARVERTGPRLIDVIATIAYAAQHALFDAPIDDMDGAR
jgi:hypothetical protein